MKTNSTLASDRIELAKLAERALALGTSTLYEASGLDCAVDSSIRAIYLGASIAAPVYPVQCTPGDNLAIHQAVALAPHGSVLLVSTGNYIAGYWGEVLTVAAQARGITGLVIDGGVRDVAAITRRGFPVFSRGISVCGTIKRSAPSVGKAIRFTGISAHPCDWLIADEDGVIVLPADQFESILQAGEIRAKKEEEMMKALALGATTIELLGLSL